MKIHPSVTINKVMKAARSEMFDLANPGFCIACGTKHHECEPDARKYTCKKCGKSTVYGAAELLQMMV